MKIFELTIENEEQGVQAISLVEHPAIQSDWIAFNNEVKVEYATVNEEKRLIIGAALIPNQPIYRKDEQNGEYYVFMSKETVRKTAENFLYKSITNDATIEHEEDIKGVTVVESWIKEGEHDKSMNFGLDLPNDTWVVVQRVNNDVIWNDYVKTGKVKGFSIEGNYSFKAPQEESKPDLIEELKKVLSTS